MFHEGGINIEGIREYLLRIISAATICAVITRIAEKQCMTSSVIKIVSGIFLSVSILSPVLRISFDPIFDYFENIQDEAVAVSDSGFTEANLQKGEIIKERLATYIVNKANTLGLQIQADVELNENMIPAHVILTGKASPYNKQKLETFITDTLGIQKEDLLWK